MAKTDTRSDRTLTRPAEDEESRSELDATVAPAEEASEASDGDEEAALPDGEVASEPLEGDGEPAEPAVEKPAPGRLRMVLLAVLAVVVVALVVAGGLIGWTVWRDHAEDQERNDTLAAARQQVLNLITINPDTLDHSIQQILAGSTGDFNKDFSGQRQAFIDAVKQQKVNSVGDISSAGVESLSGDNAVILVAAHAKVSNAQATAGEDRNYRMRVSLQRTNGHWLVSQIAFVP